MLTKSSLRRAAAGALTTALAAGVLAAGALGASSAKPAPAVPAGAKTPAPLKGPSAASSTRAAAAPNQMTSAPQDATCEVGEVCLYYLYSHQGWGAGYDMSHNDQNLFNNRFTFGGSGLGSTVGNNARAFWNRDTKTYAYVCTGLNYTGTCGYMAPNTYANFGATWADRNQSVYWADSVN